MHPRSSPLLGGWRVSHAVEAGEAGEDDSSTLTQLLEPTTGGTFSSLSFPSSDEVSWIEGGGIGITLA